MFLCWTSYWPLIKDCALQTKKIPCSPPGVPHLWSWCSPWPGWWTSRGWCWWCRGRGGREKGWYSCRQGPSGSSLSSPPTLAKFIVFCWIFWNLEWNYRPFQLFSGNTIFTLLEGEGPFKWCSYIFCSTCAWQHDFFCNWTNISEPLRRGKRKSMNTNNMCFVGS